MSNLAKEQAVDGLNLGGDLKDDTGWGRGEKRERRQTDEQRPKESRKDGR